MLHILFLILKIIGIILLVILGITLALVGVVLFVPIRYRLKTETMNGMQELRTEAHVTWLLHLISAYITYEDKEIDWLVRVGWKKFNSSQKYVDEDETNDINESGNDEETLEEKKFDTKKADATEQVFDKKKRTCEKTGEEEKSSNKKKTAPKTTSNEKNKGNWFKKIKCTIKEFCDKIKNIKEFLMEETHIQALLRLKKEIFFFIRKIKPDKIKGYLRIGLKDPYNTGQVLAVLSVLYPFYGENFQVYPEFEREIIEGDVYFKGRIHLMHLLLVLGRAYFDRNVRTAYKNIKLLGDKN